MEVHDYQTLVLFSYDLVIPTFYKLDLLWCRGENLVKVSKQGLLGMEHGSLGFYHWCFQSKRSTGHQWLTTSFPYPISHLILYLMTPSWQYQRHIPNQQTISQIHSLANSPKLSGNNPLVNNSSSNACIHNMVTLISTQNLLFAGLGFASIFHIAALLYFWRQWMAQNQLAEYTYLVANNIHLDPVGHTHVHSDSWPHMAAALAGDRLSEVRSWTWQTPNVWVQVQIWVDLDLNYRSWSSWWVDQTRTKPCCE